MVQNNSCLTGISTNPYTTGRSSISIDVGLIDTLMNLAGELVLCRNQLLQSINTSDRTATQSSSQRIDLITSELQEAIMKTRMQPIEILFQKIEQMVQKQSQKQGESLNIIIEGNDVELDKSILESINDPLLSFIRSAFEQGLTPDKKEEGKNNNTSGTILLRAFHDAGQVNILISQNHRPIRGVLPKDVQSEKEIKSEVSCATGINEIETIIKHLGGDLEIDSNSDQGVKIHIKLPLTLAIIPSQIIAVGDQRYAIPQANLDELIRIPGDLINEKIEKIGGAEVVRLRDKLLPILNLSKILGIETTYIDPETGKPLSNRRGNIADRRSKAYPDHCIPDKNAPAEIKWKHRQNKDRRWNTKSAVNIAVVSAGPHQYGILVDGFNDPEEIVVKPLGIHFQKCAAYAGATILGDGKVALILDITNLAKQSGLLTASNIESHTSEAKNNRSKRINRTSLLTFKNSKNEYFAVPLDSVDRIERIKRSLIEQIGRNKVVQYKGSALLLYELSQFYDTKPLVSKELQEVIVFRLGKREIGLMVNPPVDTVEVTLEIDTNSFTQPPILGSMIINGHTTLLIDIYEMDKQLKN